MPSPVDLLCRDCNDCCVTFCLDNLECARSCGCCCTGEVLLGPNQNLPRGTLLAQSMTDRRWYALDPTATDGRQVASRILRRWTVTDAMGRITNYNVPSFGINCSPMTADAFVCGEFLIQNTVGDLNYALQYPGFGRVLEGQAIPGGGGDGLWRLN